MSYSQTRWLSIVGIGADGIPSLSRRAIDAIEGAEQVVGGARQLELVSSLVRGRAVAWPKPLSEGIDSLVERRGIATCVVASGDPFHFGIGVSLARIIDPSEYECVPAPSSMSLAASRLGWALQDVDVVSVHGRELANVHRYLHPGRRMLVLSWNGTTPAKLIETLRARGFGASSISVFEHLGAPEERRVDGLARDLDVGSVADLNLVAVTVGRDTSGLTLPLRGALPDEAFEHDGQITKREVRALTLSALTPRPNALLWDLGAGSGSISIEWMLSHPSCKAIAVERNVVRCQQIVRNADAMGTPTLRVVEGAATNVVSALPTPDAVFIGGGATSDMIDRCWAALEPGGTLVVNGVTLETQAILTSAFARIGGELKRFSIESAVPLGTMTTWDSSYPIVQWKAVRS